MDAAGAIEKYFGDILLPRSRGLIAVVGLKEATNTWAGAPRRKNISGFLVCLSRYPFLEVNFDDGAVVLHANYPHCLAVWDERKNEYAAGYGTIHGFPKREKERWAEISSLASSRVAGGWSIGFQLCEPDSLTRAEFYTHTIITKIKYMVTTKGYNPRPKDGLDFTNLIESATHEYERKVLAPTRL